VGIVGERLHLEEDEYEELEGDDFVGRVKGDNEHLNMIHSF